MKKINILVFTIITIVILSYLLHSTPKMAIKTHVFFLGYPKVALTSEITDYQYQNIKLNEQNSSGYVFTEPPIEKETQAYLDTYAVKKVGIFYFADYINDI
ncbi:hypothetical protein ACFSFY_06320 [Sporosarcina siberiensis]|uniref:Uncharacterized protein n=1 Tax=Sporosarcina siberiensis TaxID=1365606 RepID=A0ABW4SE73_9BACL